MGGRGIKYAGIMEGGGGGEKNGKGIWRAMEVLSRAEVDAGLCGV